MAEYGLTDSGFKAPRMDTLLDVLRAEYETLAGYSPDWERDTFLGPITAVMAARLDELSDGTQEVYDARDLNNAAGLQLANLCLLANVRRREATASKVELELTGTGGTDVPVGKVIESDDGQRWELIEDGQIGDTVVFEAVDDGPIEAAEATTTWEIVTPVSGWDDVDQTDDATPGTNRETDDELRARRQASLQLGTTSTLPGIRAVLLDLDFLTAVTVLDNPTNETATVEGLSLPAKSIGVVVYPEPTVTEDEEDLARTIYVSTAAGIELSGATTATVRGGDGHDKEVAWYAASEVDVTVEVSTTLETGSVLADVTPEIEELVEDYFATLAVGQDVRRLPLYALIDGVDGVRSADITLDGSSSDVSMDATEIANLASTPTVT